MTAPVLGDPLGPRGRRKALVASAMSLAALAGLVVVALRRLGDRGQLDAAKWRPFTEGSVIRFLLGGLENTLKAAAVAMVLALLVGAVMAMGRLARNRPVRWAAGAYVEFFRALPLILLMFFAFFGLPKYGVHLSPFADVVLSLVVYNGAVLGEIFRAGILSLDRGQADAAAALGLTYGQSMWAVVIPQAARRMIPAIVSQLVTLLKDTSLGSLIFFDELLRRAQNIGTFAQFNAPYLQAVAVVAAIYIAVNFTLSRLARRLEVRQRRRFRADRIDVGGIEDLAVVSAPGGPGPRGPGPRG